MEHTEGASAAKTPRHRSPNYPGYTLKTAVDKIGEWYKKDGLVASPRDAALTHMGFEKFTGDAGRLLSALKSFGLVQEVDGRLKLTQRGVDIVARQEDDPKKIVALQEAAKGPQIYADLLKTYRSGLPSDPTLKSELIASKGFNPKAVDDFIKDFRATLKYGGISDSKVLESNTNGSEQEEQPPIREGDYVQWESQGVLQFPVVRRVTGFSENGEWAFVEGSGTGVPVKELTVQEPPALEDGEKPKAILKTPPPNPHYAAPSTTATLGVRQDVFSLSEGPVTIQWPASLSRDSFEDLAAWLDILKRKIGRSIKRENEVTLKERIENAAQAEFPNCQVVFDEQAGSLIRFRIEDADGKILSKGFPSYLPSEIEDWGEEKLSAVIRAVCGL